MYIIADVGSNWETTDDLVDSVYYAHKAGADAVKFQYYDHESLYGYKGSCGSLLRDDQLTAIRDKCNAMKTDLIITPFHESHVEKLNPLVDMWKVASSDLNYLRMLRKLSATGKKVILSTGASQLWEIDNAVSCFDKRLLALMYCVSSYPSREHDLSYVQFLKNRYRCPCGYSDHSIDVFNAAFCSKFFFGADIYEKHFKVRKFDSPDDNHSLVWSDFLKMTNRLRDQNIHSWRISASEIDMMQMHNRRFVAIKDIMPGDTFNYDENYGAYRTKSRDADRLSPFEEEHVENRKSKSKIFQGQTISVFDIE